MIGKVTIKDNTRMPFQYAEGLGAFKSGTVYEFKPGTNVIVGPNGCGKTTLLNTIANYTLCYENSKSYADAIKEGCISFLFRNGSSELMDGVSVECDYAGVVYNFKSIKEWNNDEAMENVHNFEKTWASKHSSTGETTIMSVDHMFQRAFANKDIMFPAQELCNEVKAGTVPDEWAKKYKQYVRYVMDNRMKISQEDFAYTFLMDEPDRNLDLDNVKLFEKILTGRMKKGDLTQIICVIHNPILLCLLVKRGDVNIIELEKGYVESVMKEMRRLTGSETN